MSDATPPPSRSRIFGQWVVASCVGLGTSGAVAGALAPNGGEFGLAGAPSVAAGIRNYAPRAVVAFALWGAGLGLAQWAVVRNRIPRSGLWAPMTIGGWALTGATIGVITGALGGGPAAYDAGVLGGAVAVAVSLLAIGVLPATAQWVVLRRSPQTWGSYAARFVIGLAVGGLAGWLTGTASGLTFPSGPAWVVVGTGMGAAIGVATARPVARSIVACEAVGRARPQPKG